MAWTKTKTTVAVGIIAVIAVTSMTVLTTEVKQSHRATPASPGSLSPIRMYVVMSIDTNGAVDFRGTLDEINSTTRPIRTDRLHLQGENLRITDEFGQPVRFFKQGDNGYVMTLKKAVPPAGKVSFQIQGEVPAEVVKAMGVVKPGNPDEYAFALTNYPGNDSDLHYVHTWRLPVGAIVLEKDSDMEQTSDAGQIELRLDKMIPAGSPVTMAFRYRVAAAEN